MDADFAKLNQVLRQPRAMQLKVDEIAALMSEFIELNKDATKSPNLQWPEDDLSCIIRLLGDDTGQTRHIIVALLTVRNTLSGLCLCLCSVVNGKPRRSQTIS